MRSTFHPFPVGLPDIDQEGLESAVKTYALKLRAYYHSRATWHRRMYRLSGILVILVGAGLPALANLDYSAKPLVVSLAGVVVAILTSLHVFYRWDRSWSLLRNSEASISRAYWQWQCSLPDDEEKSRTREFLVALADLRSQEADQYFADLPFPSVMPTQPTAR